jgi:hypothetical protein
MAVDDNPEGSSYEDPQGGVTLHLHGYGYRWLTAAAPSGRKG